MKTIIKQNTARKAQIKMGETLAIMFIFFILLVIGGLFWINLQRASISRDIEEAYELRAVELSQIISFLPEAQCTENNVVRASCFDLYKLVGIATIADTPEGLNLYAREFGTTTIELITLYPRGQNYTLYDNQKAEFTSAPVTNIPIMLFDRTKDEYYFGVLKVTTYT